MSFLMRNLARYVAQKAASTPQAREKVLDTARTVAREAGRISAEEDRAYAAGKAFRRFLDGVQQRDGDR